MQAEREVRAYIMLRATEDDVFRSRLLADPKGTVEAETGVTLPAEYTFHVHEETATDTHMVLPMQMDLSRQDLEAVTAGHGWHEAVGDCTQPGGPHTHCPIASAGR